MNYSTEALENKRVLDDMKCNGATIGLQVNQIDELKAHVEKLKAEISQQERELLSLYRRLLHY